MANFGSGDRFLGILLFLLIGYKLLPQMAFLISSMALLSAWIYYEYDLKRDWHKNGVPGPIDNIFFGNMFTIAWNGVGEYDKKNLQKYGNSFGSYAFDRRAFTTKDMEMFRRIFIKDFSHFQNRFAFVANDNENMQKTIFRNVITVVRNEKWKRIRNRVTPAFTSGKLKKLLPTLNECSNELCEHIETEYLAKDKELPLKDLFGPLVLGEIARGGFSLNVNVFKNEDDIFIKKVKEAFGTKWRMFFLLFLAFCPALLNFLETYFNYDLFQNSAEPFFRGLLEDLYEQRKADPDAKEKYNDIFQILLNAVDESENQESGEQIDQIDAEIFHKELSTVQGKHLTKIEMIAQSFLLLIAGNETTGTTLNFIIYLLTIFPEIQEKLREEANFVMGEDHDDVTFEHLRQMHFLKAVVQETIRFYPIAPAINRECNEDILVNGVQFRRGDMVMMPIYAVHHSEEFYPEPEKFDPERFMPQQKAERNPMTFVGFGLGPRNCIGMRLAEFQMHVAVAVLVRRFRFFRSPNTPEFPLKIHTRDMLRPAKPLVVMAEKI